MGVQRFSTLFRKPKTLRLTSSMDHSSGHSKQYPKARPTRNTHLYNGRPAMNPASHPASNLLCLLRLGHQYPVCLPQVMQGDAVWCVAMWCGVVWCGVVWCGVVWCGVVWCGVVWCGVVWCGVVWCGVVWCGVVWCGVVWCGVVWCGVVWCGVPKALPANGNGRDALHMGNAKREGCVC